MKLSAFALSYGFPRQDLVRAVYNLIACEVWEDGALVITVGRCHKPSAALGLQAVLAHQATDLLEIDSHLAVAQLGPNPAIAIGLDSSQIAIIAATIAASSAGTDGLS
jgi:hypothetical protein